MAIFVHTMFTERIKETPEWHHKVKFHCWYVHVSVVFLKLLTALLI